MKTITISILSMQDMDFANLQDTLAAMETSMIAAKRTLAKQGIDVNFGWHLDIMDGKYIKPIALCPQLLSAILHSINLRADLHFMTNSILPYVDVINKHIAKIDDIQLHLGTDAIDENLDVLNRQTFDLTFNLDEPVYNNISLLAQCKSVLLMSVVPGKGGQAYNSVSNTIRAIKAYAERHDVDIPVAVDGGVNLDTISDCVAADKIIVGSAFTKLLPHEYLDFLVKLGKIFA